MTLHEETMMRMGIRNLKAELEAQWAAMNRADATDAQRSVCEGQYRGMVQALKLLGGRCGHDDKGHHWVSLAGMYSWEIG